VVGGSIWVRRINETQHLDAVAATYSEP
jgi:hypothetical protein